MLARFPPLLVAGGGSVLLLTGLIAALYLIGEPHSSDALVVYCAEAMRLPLEAVARDYEAEFGQKALLDFGASQTMLSKLKLAGNGDLFLPADESYIRLAREDSLVGEVFPLAKIYAVLVVSPHCPKTIAAWNDILAKDVRLGLANPEAAAISKLLKRELLRRGLWDAVVRRDPKYLGNVSEVANSALLGSIDVGVVWDVIALPHPELRIVRVQELENVEAQVQIALATSSKQPDNARRFVRFLRAKDQGAHYLRKYGYSGVEEGTLE